MRSRDVPGFAAARSSYGKYRFITPTGGRLNESSGGKRTVTTCKVEQSCVMYAVMQNVWRLPTVLDDRPHTHEFYYVTVSEKFINGGSLGNAYRKCVTANDIKCQMSDFTSALSLIYASRHAHVNRTHVVLVDDDARFCPGARDAIRRTLCSPQVRVDVAYLFGFGTTGVALPLASLGHTVRCLERLRTAKTAYIDTDLLSCVWSGGVRYERILFEHDEKRGASLHHYPRTQRCNERSRDFGVTFKFDYKNCFGCDLFPCPTHGHCAPVRPMWPDARVLMLEQPRTELPPAAANQSSGAGGAGGDFDSDAPRTCRELCGDDECREQFAIDDLVAAKTCGMVETEALIAADPVVDQERIDNSPLMRKHRRFGPICFFAPDKDTIDCDASTMPVEGAYRICICGGRERARNVTAAAAVVSR